MKKNFVIGNRTIYSIMVLIILLGSSLFIAVNSDGSGNNHILYDHYTSLNSNSYGPIVPVASYIPFYNQYGVSNFTEDNGSPASLLTVVVSLYPTNCTFMNSLLSEISDPSSTMYHHFLSLNEFNQMFGGPQNVYNNLVSYVKTSGAVDIQEFSDRSILGFKASANTVKNIFSITIENYTSPIGDFYAPAGTPSLPLSIEPYVQSISGLSDYSELVIGHSPLISRALKATGFNSSSKSTLGYPIPVNYSGAQYISGSDLQVAMNEVSLFKQYGYPTNMVEATILWSGVYNGSGNVQTREGLLKPGTYVGPFDPSDIYDYYNETIPPGEPHSKVYGYPINGAPEPSFLSSYDTTGANVENTLDLEMLGSTAPGSTIYNAYGNTSSISCLDLAFAALLNPSQTSPAYSNLLNLSVISNSWGGTDCVNPTWNTMLKEANLRGITVMAASGDGGDCNSTSSPEYIGSNESFPASVAYDNYGMLAVGGVSMYLNTNLSIVSEKNWFVPATLSTGYAVGTTSGISHLYAEPSWQVNSSANLLINGAGRGVPDLSSLANDTIMTITICGDTYYASNASIGRPFEAVAGTSIASPSLGGILAEIDHSLLRVGDGKMGFVNPEIYRIGTLQYTNSFYSGQTGILQQMSYNSSLPSLAFHPVVKGCNVLYQDRYGYSLLNGWGTVNAYNLTNYLMDQSFNGISGDLSGISASINLTGLNVTSYSPNGTVFSKYNATIEENFFLAGETGFPEYWAQSMLQIYGVNSSDLIANFSISINTPFSGTFRNERLSVYNSTEVIIPFKKTFNLTSVILSGNTSLSSVLITSVGASSLKISVPGSSFIIGKKGYTYYYNGSILSLGQFPGQNSPLSLVPQIVLAGAISSKTGVFGNGTSGTIIPQVEPYGSGKWEMPLSSVIDYASDQTQVTGANLIFQNTSNDTWYVNYSSKSLQQGIAFYVKGNYVVTFNESGLPAGTYYWVNVSGLLPSGPIAAGSSFTTNVTDGPYTYSVSASNPIYAPKGNGTFTIDGSNLSIHIIFIKKVYLVEFRETGLTGNVTWSVNVSGIASSGPLQRSSYFLNLTNGTYHYTFNRSSDIFSAASLQGNFTVNGSNVIVPIEFFRLTYLVTLSESGLPSGQNWTIEFNGTVYHLSSNPLVLSLSNGTYVYSVTNVTGYTTSPLTGSLIINGSAASLVINFTKPTPIPYEVEFTLIIIAMVVVASLIFVALIRRGKFRDS